MFLNNVNTYSLYMRKMEISARTAFALICNQTITIFWLLGHLWFKRGSIQLYCYYWDFKLPCDNKLNFMFYISNLSDLFLLNYGIWIWYSTLYEKYNLFYDYSMDAPCCMFWTHVQNDCKVRMLLRGLLDISQFQTFSTQSLYFGKVFLSDSCKRFLRSF